MAVLVVFTLFVAAVMGKVSFGERDAKTIEALTKAVSDLVPLVREQKVITDRMVAQQEFLVGFVRDIIREQGRVRTNLDDRPDT